MHYSIDGNTFHTLNPPLIEWITPSNEQVAAAATIVIRIAGVARVAVATAAAGGFLIIARILLEQRCPPLDQLLQGKQRRSTRASVRGATVPPVPVAAAAPVSFASFLSALTASSFVALFFSILAAAKLFCCFPYFLFLYVGTKYKN